MTWSLANLAVWLFFICKSFIIKLLKETIFCELISPTTTDNKLHTMKNKEQIVLIFYWFKIILIMLN